MLVKLTVNGGLHDPVLSAVKEIVGFGKTVIVLETESLHAPKPATIFITKLPVVLYVLVGFTTVEVVPSPKLHVTFTGTGALVLVSIKGVFSQIIEGMEKSAFPPPTVIAFAFMIVSVQPVEVVTNSLTV